MRSFSQILCVIDPAARSQPALERAAWIARNSGAAIELFVCYYNEYLSGDPLLFGSPTLATARKEVIAGNEKYLAELAAPLQESGLTVNSTVLWDHPLYRGIARHAAAIDADLVLKDTHSRSAMERVLLSHTDWNLIRTCASPVWLVKPHDLPEPPLIVAAIDPMNEHDKPAALDDEILVLAEKVAKISNAEVHAFHAYDPRLAMATSAQSPFVPISLPFDEIEKEMGEVHKKRFDEIAEFHGIGAERRHLVAGLAHRELPALATELKAALVVMGAVARNPLQRLFIGATAERTLEDLPCDLLIVKPPWFRMPDEVSDDRA